MAAQDPSAAPPAAGGDASGGAGGGDSPDKAIAALGDGLNALAQAVPDFQPVADAFNQVVDKLQGGGSTQADQGAVTPEQGANPGAMPMSMKGP